MIKALFRIARSFAQIAATLDRIEALYRLDLASQNVYEPNPDLTDEVEISYGPKSTPSD